MAAALMAFEAWPSKADRTITETWLAKELVRLLISLKFIDPPNSYDGWCVDVRWQTPATNVIVVRFGDQQVDIPDYPLFRVLTPEAARERLIEHVILPTFLPHGY